MAEIEIQYEEALMIIKLNRPDKANSFNRAMAMALRKALEEARQSVKVRAVLLTANGKAFSAGQDLAEAVEGGSQAIRTIIREQYNPIILAMRTIEKPVICAVNGVAAGAGANIAFAADILLAASKASFIQAFSKIGLVPDSGGTFFLPRLIGLQRASALMLSGDKLSAEEALQMGLVYKVFPESDFERESLALALKLSAMPTRALALTKKLLNQSMQNNLDMQLQAEEDLQVEAATSADHAEGIKAFLEKRMPVFSGQ